MIAVAFVNGSYFKDTEHYGYAAEVFLNNEKHIVRGSGNESALTKMWSIGAKLKGTEEAIKKAIELKAEKVIVVNNLDFLEELVYGICKPRSKGNVDFSLFLKSAKEKIKIVVRRPTSSQEIKKLEELRILARETLGL